MISIFHIDVCINFTIFRSIVYLINYAETSLSQLVWIREIVCGTEYDIKIDQWKFLTFFRFLSRTCIKDYGIVLGIFTQTYPWLASRVNQITNFLKRCILNLECIQVPFISLGNLHSMKLQTKQKTADAEERDTMIIVFLDLLLLPNVPDWKEQKRKMFLRNFWSLGICIYKKKIWKQLLEFEFMSRK